MIKVKKPKSKYNRLHSILHCILLPTDLHRSNKISCCIRILTVIASASGGHSSQALCFLIYNHTSLSIVQSIFHSYQDRDDTDLKLYRPTGFPVLVGGIVHPILTAEIRDFGTNFSSLDNFDISRYNILYSRRCCVRLLYTGAKFVNL